MNKLYLANDEVILLEEFDIWYSGRIDEICFDEVYLRIACYGTKKRQELNLDIPLSDIKKYKGKIQADYFEHDEYGDCLRLQTIKGVEYFSIEDSEESVGGFFKSVFSTKIKENRRVSLWIEKISEALNSDEMTNSNVVTNDINESHTIQSSVDDNIKESSNNFIICDECGNKYDKNHSFCPSCGTPTVKPKIIEVVICRKCGTRINNGNRFCPSCGTSVIDEINKEEKTVEINIKNEESEKKEVKSIISYKCSVCGEILPSNAIKCPSCGHEIHSREVVSSIKEFSRTVATIEDENKKIEYIKTFPIPNTKEDIMEFMYLASSNFDATYYATNKQGESVASAWKIKMDQCYNKAKIMFDQSDMIGLEKIYKSLIVEVDNIKKTKRIFIILGIVALIISMIMIGLTPETDSEDPNAKANPLSYFGAIVFIVGIILLVVGLKRKKTSKEIEEARIAKENRRKQKN